MDPALFEKLAANGLISDASLQKIKTAQQGRLFSLHAELRTLLYLGVLLLSGGLGVLVYENIDSIGHTAILIFIALVSAAGFLYCSRHRGPYQHGKVESPGIMYDYVLLLACLAFVSFIGYLQFQYHFFGTRYGLAVFVPMLLLFFCAYYYDHLGVLSLAITSLCAWAGITVTPTRILQANDFSSDTVIYTGLVLGAGLTAIGRLSDAKAVKAHFGFTYTNFGMHLLFISSLAGMFVFENSYLLWFLLLAGIAFYFYVESMRTASFYLLLILTLYGYIGISTVFIRLLFFTLHADAGGIQLTFMYFIATAVLLILFLMRMNKKIHRS